MRTFYFLAVLWLSGCTLVPPSPVTRLYTLTALTQINAEPLDINKAGVAIGIGPIELPAYVDRPQIITGDGGNELLRAEFAQWAEPLNTNVTRILARNLALLLKTERIVVFPWQSPVPLDYQVVVEVTHFLGALNGMVSLNARWRVLGKNGREVLVSRQSSFTEATTAHDYAALVSTMSNIVALLSSDIATTITDLKL